MMSKMSAADSEKLKESAASQAVDDHVRSNMILGLGTGTTAAYVVSHIGEKFRKGELTNIVGIPTSEATRKQAESLGIPLTTLDAVSRIDVALDGADEFATEGRRIIVKGRGAALYREKMVALRSDKFVIIMDSAKFNSELGFSGCVPVEVSKFAPQHTIRDILSASAARSGGDEPILLMPPGTKAQFRKDAKPPPTASPDAIERGADFPKAPVSYEDCYVTDNGNFIVDLYFPSPVNPVACGDIAEGLKSINGVLDHGFFVDMPDVVVQYSCITGAITTSSWPRKPE